MLRYNNLNKKVSSWSAVDSGFTLFSYSYALAVINAGRNCNLDLLATCNVSGSVTVCTLLFDDLTCTATFRTCLNVSYSAKEGLLCIYNLSLTAALGTCLW